MAIDFSNVWPYNAMKKVTVDGQEMVRIPKIYVRNMVLPNTSKYAGKVSYSIAKEKLDDTWHVHPAFMNGGQEMSALDLSCYEASKDSSGKPASVATTTYWENVDRATAIDACSKRNVAGGTADQSGWHCWDIYCQHLLARLMLIENGATNFDFKEDGSDYVYRGIHQPAGNPLHPMWLPGLSMQLGKLLVYTNEGLFQAVNTGFSLPNDGWPTKFTMIKGDNFDLGDIFIAETVASENNNGACSCWQRFIPYGESRQKNEEIGYFTGYRGPYPYSNEPEGAHGMFAISPGRGHYEGQTGV